MNTLRTQFFRILGSTLPLYLAYIFSSVASAKTVMRSLASSYVTCSGGKAKVKNLQLHA